MKRYFLLQLFAGLILGSVANASVHTVNQVGMTFQPSEITVAPGDTIRWVWSSLSHTVTSGTNCQADGIWFNMPFNVLNPEVTWVVPDAAVGDVPYFCIPHCAFGMTALIHVVAPCPGDLDSNGFINITDMLTVINAWGQMNVPEDIDGSGVVDIGDLMTLISAWGPC